MDVARRQAQVSVFYFNEDGDFFLSAVARLVSALLAHFGDEDFTGRFADALDGIYLEYADRQRNAFTGYGVAFILGSQDWEPILLNLRFDETAREMTGATILFGAVGAKLSQASRGERRRFLAKTMLAMALDAKPPLEFEWKYAFTQANGEWS